MPEYIGAYFGKVARFNLKAFGNVEVLDLTATDSSLKGFGGGFCEGTYGNVLPEHNGAYFGKVARFIWMLLETWRCTTSRPRTAA